MRGQNAPKTGRRRTRNDFAYIHFSARFPLPRRRREIIIYRKSESTEAGSSIRFCAFFLLQAFGFSGLRVTGLMAQSVRLSASCSRFFFFESFSYGINFSMRQTSFSRMIVDTIADQNPSCQGRGSSVQVRSAQAFFILPAALSIRKAPPRRRAP